MLIISLILQIKSCKIRLYHRDLYLGLLPDRDSVPTMVNYEVAQKFETEFVDLYSLCCYIRVKDTTNYVLHVAHDRSRELLYWSKHGGEDQRWVIVHGPLNVVKFKNEDLCLEYLPDDDLLRMQNCNESENQMFNIIEDEDEDHGLATQANVTVRHDLDGNFVNHNTAGGAGGAGGGAWGAGAYGIGGWGSDGAGHVGCGGGGWDGHGGLGAEGWGAGHGAMGAFGGTYGVGGFGAGGHFISGAWGMCDSPHHPAWNSHNHGHHAQNKAYHDHGHGSAPV